MGELDDVPLVRAEGVDGLLSETGRRTTTTPIVLVAVAGLALGALGAWWWARDRSPAAPAARPTAATEAAVAPEAARPLPPLGQMDIFLRTLLGTLSSSPELARWLATDDLIHQMANGIDQVSRGASPARELGVVRPPGIFQTTGRGTLTIAPASYRRFDGLASMVASLDAASVASAYRTIQPRLDEAYRGLGRTEGGVDQAVSAALQVLIDTPSPASPIELVPGPGATWAFADPALEKLAPAQKQLLRMGPDNAARIKARLLEIKAAIESSNPSIPVR